MKIIFTWWNKQTFGTFLKTLFTGKYVGKDKLGNKYYKNKNDERWVIYSKNIEATKIQNAVHIKFCINCCALQSHQSGLNTPCPTSGNKLIEKYKSINTIHNNTGVIKVANMPILTVHDFLFSTLKYFIKKAPKIEPGKLKNPPQKRSSGCHFQMKLLKYNEIPLVSPI